jgi:hypothetical protein
VMGESKREICYFLKELVAGSAGVVFLLNTKKSAPLT